MGTRLRNAPVFFVIAQVKFNTLFALDAYAPSIQDQMRKAGFPDSERGVLSVFNLTPVGLTDGNTPQVPVSQLARYSFLNLDRTEGFILEQGALSFQATEYDVFNTFSASLLAGLRIVESAVGGLSYSDRVGVRYLDAIFPPADESLSDYLDGSVLGLVNKLEGELVHSFSETVTRAPAATVISRTVIQNGGIGYPPDLLPMPLRTAERFEALNGLHAIIDTDGAYEKREPFDIEALSSKLRAIHEDINKAFRATVTSHAFDVWR